MHLLNVLMNLPMKAGDQTERNRLIDDGPAVDDANEVILELDWNARMNLINCLIENHHFAILYNSSAS